MYRSGYTVQNNQFLTYGDGFDFTRADNVTVSGNTVNFTNGQCGTYVGTALTDSHTAGSTSNTLFVAAAAARADRRVRLYGAEPADRSRDAQHGGAAGLLATVAGADPPLVHQIEPNLIPNFYVSQSLACDRTGNGNDERRTRCLR